MRVLDVEVRRQRHGRIGLRLAAVTLVPRHENKVVGQVVVVFAVHRRRRPRGPPVDEEQHRFGFGSALDFQVLLHPVDGQ